MSATAAPVVVALAAAGVLSIVLAVFAGWRIARRRTRLDDPQAVMDDAAGRLAGFDPVAAVVSADGVGALTVAADGRLALLRAGRRRPSLCEVGWAQVRATAGGIEVRPARARALLLTGVDALDMRRLAPAGKRIAETE